jgi:predicted DNA-binding mobile mystery protein A
MTNPHHALAVRQLDAMLAGWRPLVGAQPKTGWLRTLRSALGLTTRQLARRMGVSQAAVVAAERSEVNQDLTLTTLRRYAQAMDCEVVYALIPRRPLEEQIEAQADQVAREEVRRVRESMALENQSTDVGVVDQQVKSLKRRLLEGRPSRLWQ